MRKAKKQLKAVCPKCFQVKLLQRHHYLPSRFFKKNNSNNVLHICDKCHKEIEEILSLYRKLKKEEYIDIHKNWLKGKNVTVYPKNKIFYLKKETQNAKQNNQQQQNLSMPLLSGCNV